MASFTRGPANVDDILASTLDEYRDKLTENWVSGNPLTKKLMEQGNMDLIDGGNDIIESLEYDDNDTAAWINQTDTVSTTVTPMFTDARFAWAVLGGTVTIGDHDLAKNTGRNQRFNLLRARMTNLEATFKEKFETALGASSTPDTKTMWSLPDIVDSSNPTIANLGDISRSTYSWWQATETASGSMATQGLEDIRTAYYTTSRSQTDPVNMIVTTQTIYEAYQARHTPFMRFASNDKADLEFDHLLFNNKPVFYSENMATGLLIGINTKYLRLRVNKNLNFHYAPDVRPLGGASATKLVQTMCQLTVTRPGSLFKLTGMVA